MADGPITVMHHVAALIGYLAGSVPFGLVLTRLAGVGDIRGIGSGNIGATNVLRTGHKGLAALTLLLDAAKGAAAVLLMAQWGEAYVLIAGVFAVLGHDFPVWLRFRGGKGVATSLGVLAALDWPVALLCSLIWLGCAVVFRYSSLAALIAFAASPFVMYWFAGPNSAVIAAILAVLGIFRHGDNIRRLWRGEEPRIGRARAAAGH